MRKNALIIAGYDPSAAAGLLRDVATLNDHGVYGSAIVTALTSQNSRSCGGVWPVSPEIIDRQIALLLEDYDYSVVKIGMLGSMENASAILGLLTDLDVFVTLDPVFVSSGGTSLADEDLIEFTRERFIKRSSIVTPNVSEAATLCGFDIEEQKDVERAAVRMLEMGTDAVFIKGSHLAGDPVVDTFFDGRSMYRFEHDRIVNKQMRGTGCTFASALTANIALGYDMKEAAGRAVAYTSEAIRKAALIGKGNPQAWI